MKNAFEFYEINPSDYLCIFNIHKNDLNENSNVKIKYDIKNILLILEVILYI